MRAYQIKIELKGSDPLIWRRVLIPAEASFRDLHDVIQKSLAFRDKHLHVFTIPNENLKITNDQEAFELYQEYLVEQEQIQATLLALGTNFAKDQLKALQTVIFKPEEVYLKAYFKVGKQVDYLYDFGDRWEISIEWENIISDNTEKLPRLLAGACGAPVEDMGGLEDFEEFRAAYTNLEHQNHAITFKWGKEQGFLDYDPQGIQEELLKIVSGVGRINKMKIVVTGGTGYIGSHTSVELLKQGHEVIIVDNLVNSEATVVDRIYQITNERPIFYQADATDEGIMDLIFSTHRPDGVIHFAGLKAVGESVQLPLNYYRNNLLSTMVVLDNCLKYGVKRFVFSSSATVYGDNKVPFFETTDLLPRTNPYGESKAICERILTDCALVNPELSVTLLRYFNPVGAHESGLIGEVPSGIPNNLMPYITQVAKGILEELKIFGNDYPTPDGTGVRDYIHVLDLAEGHLAALEQATPGVHIYNLGTGKGTSVLELVQAFEEANNLQIPYSITKRRPGDIAECYADVSKAREQLGWTAKLGILEMCKDAWRFEKAFEKEERTIPR